MSALSLSWQVTTAILLLVAYRIVAERQRHATLVALVERAPAGTLIVQDRAGGGAAMWVQVGHGRARG